VIAEARPELVLWASGRWPDAGITRLAGDASTRSFFRVAPRDAASIVVMDYGKPFSGPTDDIRLNGVFVTAGLPVARILEVVPRPGCLVLEDLGDRTLQAAAVADPANTEPLLERAVALAVEIAARGTPALAQSDRAAGPALDAERFRFEMGFFARHYVEGYLGRPALAPEVLRELHDLAVLAAEAPRRVLCHRDFHSRNLLVRPGGDLVMVDIQDARWGPDCYDLASILFDAYIEIAPAVRERLVETFRVALPDAPAAGEFRGRFARVAAQRMLKALGTFGYQIAVRNKVAYRSAIPRTVARLDTLLPALDELPRLASLRDLIG